MPELTRRYRIADPPTRPDIASYGMPLAPEWGSNPVFIQELATYPNAQWMDWMYLGDEPLRDLYETIGKYLAKKARDERA